MPPFPYRKLDSSPTDPEIRLVRLLPGSGAASDPLRLEVLHARLFSADHPPYEALSYCWGAPTPSRTIHLDGAPVEVGPNLFAALLHLRRRPGDGGSSGSGEAPGSSPGGNGDGSDSLPDARRSSPAEPDDGTRTLWVDALCIDQGSTAEKNEQVPLMRDVYAGAAGVVIWVGPASLLSARAVRILRALTGYVRRWPGRKVPGVHQWRDAERRLLRAAVDDGGAAGGGARAVGERRRGEDGLATGWIWDRLLDTVALELFWRRPWFYRVWVLQEAAVCRSAVLCCGAASSYFTLPFRLFGSRGREACGDDAVVDWDALVDYQARDADNLTVRYEAQGPSVSRRAYRRRRNDDLFVHFVVNESAQATEKRDKVYALLGLALADRRGQGHGQGPGVAAAGGSETSAVQVDYGKELGDVFVDFTRACLRGRNGTNVLAASRGDERARLTGLPSWSLDWEVDERKRYTETFTIYAAKSVPGNRAADDVCAAKGSRPAVVFGGDGERLLGVMAQELDTIVALGDWIPDGSSWSQTVRTVRAYLAWRDIAGLSSAAEPYPPTGQPRREVFWRTLGWFEHHSTAPQYGRTSIEEDAALAKFDETVVRLTRILSWWTWASTLLGVYLLSVWTAARNLASAAGLPGARKTWLASLLAPFYRALFRTEKGYLGLATYNARVGDRVFLVNGAAAPVLLRPSGSRWRVVGEAYVHGVMSGEAFEESRSDWIWIE